MAVAERKSPIRYSLKLSCGRMARKAFLVSKFGKICGLHSIPSHYGGTFQQKLSLFSLDANSQKQSLHCKSGECLLKVIGK